MLGTGDFDAGAFQDDPLTDIQDIGEEPVTVASLLPSSFPSVNLGVPAVLGTLTTPAGLGAGDFLANDFGLFNAAGDGFFSGEITETANVVPIPEPTTAVLLGMGGMAVLTRRRSRA